MNFVFRSRPVVVARRLPARPLRGGDRFGIAGSTFVYEIDEDTVQRMSADLEARRGPEPVEGVMPVAPVLLRHSRASVDTRKSSSTAASSLMRSEPGRRLRCSMRPWT